MRLLFEAVKFGDNSSHDNGKLIHNGCYYYFLGLEQGRLARRLCIMKRAKDSPDKLHSFIGNDKSHTNLKYPSEASGLREARPGLTDLVHR